MGNLNVANQTIFVGDNLPVLRGLNDECIDLVYLDPPFDTGRVFTAAKGSQAEGTGYKDKWELSDVSDADWWMLFEEHREVDALLDLARRIHSPSRRYYLAMLAVRLIEIKRVLKATGSLYLHCDTKANGYLRLLLDAIFGKTNFRNEIVWCYPPVGISPKFGYPKKHDCILFYGKSDCGTWQQPYTEMTEATLKAYSKKDSDGRVYWEGYNGNRTYLDMNKGRAVPSWWDDITIAAKSAIERNGYETQKPIKLLERIVKASSNEGDVILDPFCGSGTALEAAEKHGRQWIGVDLTAQDWDGLRKRMQKASDDNALLNGGVLRDITIRTDVPERGQ